MPSNAEYSQAIQNPRVCFRSQPLAEATVAFGPRGMPLVYSGSFACVYKVSLKGKNFAVRCFTREVRDEQYRYGQIAQALKTAALPEFTDFDYLERGIQINGEWYPVVKMDWVEGETLDKFVAANLDNPQALRELAYQWRLALAGLRDAGIAHNDLQHGNVIVDAGAVRLVDYDGMFLPWFQGTPSPELGHKNYQHPQRSERDYAGWIDNFPALVIYLSLLAISATPHLWESFHNGDNLILTEQDYADPGNSDCLRRLKESPDANIARLAAILEQCCSLPVAQTPDLDEVRLTVHSSRSRPASYRELLGERQISGQAAANPQAPVTRADLQGILAQINSLNASMRALNSIADMEYLATLTTQDDLEGLVTYAELADALKDLVTKRSLAASLGHRVTRAELQDYVTHDALNNVYQHLSDAHQDRQAISQALLEAYEDRQAIRTELEDFITEAKLVEILRNFASRKDLAAISQALSNAHRDRQSIRAELQDYIQGNFASQEDLESVSLALAEAQANRYAIRDELEKFITEAKLEILLRNFASQADLAAVSQKLTDTEADLEILLRNFASQGDLAAVSQKLTDAEAKLESLRRNFAGRGDLEAISQKLTDLENRFAATQVQCDSCAGYIPAGALFCAHCGHNLESGQGPGGKNGAGWGRRLARLAKASVFRS